MSDSWSTQKTPLGANFHQDPEKFFCTHAQYKLNKRLYKKSPTTKEQKLPKNNATTFYEFFLKPFTRVCGSRKYIIWNEELNILVDKYFRNCLKMLLLQRLWNSYCEMTDHDHQSSYWNAVLNGTPHLRGRTDEL